MLQLIRIEMANANRISDLGLVCLWSVLGLLLTEVMYVLGFGATITQAMLMAG